MKLRFSRTGCSGLLAAVAFLGVPKCAFAEERWLKLTSANFELFTTEKEKAAKEALLYFEQVRSFFLQATHSTEGTPLPVRIVAFRSEKEFLPFRPNEFVEAYYQGGRERDYIVMQHIRLESFPVVVHEYMHVLTEHSGLRLPVWLNEGLADVFSTLKAAGGRVQVGAPLPGRLQVLREKKWLDLETLTAVDHNSPYYNERDRAGLFYSQSWLLTHLLFLSDEYRSKFPEFLVSLLSSSSPAAAVQKVYGKSLPAVRRDLERYMQGDRVNVALYPIQLEKSAEQPEAHEATALESGLALAGLMALLRKPADARARYLSLARDNPNDREVEEGLGYLELGNGASVEARRHFARAAELGSTNAKMYFDYAALSQAAGDEDVALSALKRAADLKPDYQEAQYHLGLALYNKRRYGEALGHLSVVKKVTPEQACAFFQVMALTLHGLAAREQAIVAAKNARAHARTQDEIASTDRLLQYVNGESKAPSRATLDQVVQNSEGEAGDERDRAAIDTSNRAQASSVQGVLQQLDCTGPKPRLRILVNGKEAAFLLSGPVRVVSRGPETRPAGFRCGPLEPKTVALEFLPQEDAKLGIQGAVTSIEFK